MNTVNKTLLAAALILATVGGTGSALAQNSNQKMEKMSTMKMGMMHMSSAFKGIEVNGGTVSYSVNKGVISLMLSEDFKIPGTPAPHWQVVDTKGNTYLLQQLRVKDEKQNRMIKLPSYIKSVAKVQIWCSFAEVNLGEAVFKKPAMAH